MNNFLRALRMALRKRLTLAGSVACALVVAIMWAGSITAVYPLVEVTLRAETMHEWIDYRAEYGKETKQFYERQVVRFRQLLEVPSPAEQRESIERYIQHLEDSAQKLQERAAVREAQREIAKLKGLLLHPHRQRLRAIADELAEAQDRVRAEEKELARVRWLQPIIHATMPTDSFQTLLVIVAFLALSTMFKSIFSIANVVLVSRLAQSAALDLRTRFFQRTLQLDLASAHEQGRGDLMNRFTSDMGSVSAGIQILFGRAILEPLKMTVCLVLAARCCWRLLVLTFILTPLAGFLINRLARSLKRANRRAMEEMSHIYHALSEILGGIQVVKAFTMETYEQNRFRETARKYYLKAMKIARYNSLISPLNETMGIAMICLAVLVSGYLSLNHETHIFGIKISERRLTTGVCLLFYALLAGMIDPARKLSDVFGRLQNALAASDRLFQVLDRVPTVTDPENPRPLPRHCRDLVLEDVDFRYQPERRVLEDINLRIAFGETVAIVGPNGCGKSTLASLILRFFDPSRGRVALDGIDLREVRQHDLRKQIGLVTQETLLFDESVLENIRYGSPHVNRDAVIDAAQRAQAHQFIENKLSDGYDTLVGPGGNRLSGGERQRIALARAILRDPPILILDEATSQIDLESEQIIQQVLKHFTRDRTTIVITHRLATLSLANRIVVMDDGRIRDVGTHEQLIARCDFYRRIYQIDLQQSA